MPVIYEPAGRAQEFSSLAINLFTGCAHSCRYCFCPLIFHKTLDEWALNPGARTRIIQQITREAKKLYGEPRPCLLCFMSDPYQSDEAAYLTGEALVILELNKFQNVQVLTKAGFRAERHFQILKDNGWKFGSTIIFRTEELRKLWEPGAPSIESRYQAVKNAHAAGVKTWVSVEPVVDPAEALKVMKDLTGHVDQWKVGKLNHFHEVESKINWAKFLQDARAVLAGQNVYWKKDLLAFDSFCP